MKKFKWTSVHHARRCGHSWCTGCKTRRGRNRGNRRVRHGVHAELTAQRKLGADRIDLC